MLLVARSKSSRARRGVSYRLPEDLLDQLDKLTEHTRRTATAELEIAIENHLKKAKLWPIEEAEEDDDD